MLDAALFYKEKSDRISTVLSDNKLKQNSFVLTTIHREKIQMMKPG
jgi:hypothetical protein